MCLVRTLFCHPIRAVHFPAYCTVENYLKTSYTIIIKKCSQVLLPELVFNILYIQKKKIYVEKWNKYMECLQ